MAEKDIFKRWLEETDWTIDALQEWRRKLQQWQQSGCDNGEFQAALWTLRTAGLEAWADRNPAGLDTLADAATSAFRELRPQ
jgi:hypothetical protein